MSGGILGDEPRMNTTLPPKQSFGKKLLSLLCGILSIVLVLAAGQLLADYAHRFLSEKEEDMPVLSVVDQPFSERSTLKPDSMAGLISQYVFSYLDAAIRFDFIPVSDYRALLNIISSVPDRLYIDGFQFEKGEIHILYHGEENTADLFIYHLIQKDYFKGVYPEESETQKEIVCLC